jgi:tRNA 5-methylaminomethyl-2-thiouridine biosynthesis bifunctional protein
MVQLTVSGWKCGFIRSAIMKYAEIEWNNGTPGSTQFGDVYYSAGNGLKETQYVFLQQNELPQRWQQVERFVIAETGFGTGLNFLVTMKTWLQSAADNACLYFISIENYPVSPEDISKLASQWSELKPYIDELLYVYPPPVPGMHLLELAGGKVKLLLIFDEVEAALGQINTKVDVWFLDGFAPARNPAMWSERVFELIGRNTRIGGSFATYTASGLVRRGLSKAGFVVQKSQGYGDKRDMLKGFIFERRCYVVEKPWFAIPETTCNDKNAVVIGAGLAGLATAWALVKRGWKITLIDRHATIAEGASGNPAGLLMPRLSRNETLDSRFYINAYVHAIRCLNKLQANSNDQFWFKSGNMLVDDADKLKHIRESHQYPENFIKYINRDDTENTAGISLRHDALLFVGAGWIKVKLLCDAIKRECAGQLKLVHANVSDVRFNQGKWHITGENSNTIMLTSCVVLANGSMARYFPVVEWLPLEAVRGQLTIIEQTDKSRKIKCGISADRYITPAHEGKHILGASFNLDDESLELSSFHQEENISSINRLIPAGFEQQSEQKGRVAFRAVSKDMVPMVGCVPDQDKFEHDYQGLHHGRPSRLYPAGAYLPGLYISTAHGSRGLASCFISGEIIASLICADPLPVEKELADYLNPARFIIRRLKRDHS